MKNIDVSKYTFVTTYEGVEVSVRKGWEYKKDIDNDNRNTIVTNGEVNLRIGSVIEYAPIGSTYTGKWLVLGAENGYLLILLQGMVGMVTINGRTRYKDAVELLDNLCKPLGNGLKAVSARSIRVEDVDKITGYNPNNIGAYDPEKIAIGNKYGGQIYEYGNIVTYSYTGDGTYRPKYVRSNGTNAQCTTAYKYTFYWYNIAEELWIDMILHIRTELKNLLNQDFVR